MPLNSLAVQNAKTRENFYVLTDGNSLHLLIKPNGSKLWRFRYRFGGKQNMLSLGSFPEISLADARAKRDDAPHAAPPRYRRPRGRRGARPSETAML